MVGNRGLLRGIKMTVFENLMSKNIDELVEWLDENGAVYDSPWKKWYNKTYCRKCNADECRWCQLYNKCKFFPEMNRVPNRRQKIKLWLESEN